MVCTKFLWVAGSHAVKKIEDHRKTGPCMDRTWIGWGTLLGPDRCRIAVGLSYLLKVGLGTDLSWQPAYWVL